MASEWSAVLAQHLLPYKFQDISLLHQALIAGDTNSDNREGHRGMAQVGDALMSFVIMSEGFDRGIPRNVQQQVNSEFVSKEKCSMLARALSLDQLVRISVRQHHKGPQPTVLKNTLAAIVAAVWLESRNYQAVVQVMASLGLVNSHGPSITSQGSQHEDWMPSSSTEFGWPDVGAAEMDAMMIDANLETALDADFLRHDWTTLTFQDSAFNDWFVPEPNQNPSFVSDVTNSVLNVEDEVSRFNNQCMLENIMSTVDPSMLHVGTDPRQPSSSTYQNASTHCTEVTAYRVDNNASDAENGNTPFNAPQASQRQGVTGSSQGDSNTSLKSRAGSPSRLIFKMYLNREAEKLNDQPELFTHYYGYMRQYQEALTPYHRDFAKLAVAIGDSSAMVLLKQAIESARSPPNNGSLHIGRKMSPEQRLQAIHHLDVCMAHLRLARWLHIHQLYEELSRDVGGKDVDNFVVITNADFCESSNEPGAIAQRGNPRNIEQAVITRRMMGSTNVDSNTDESRKSQWSMKRLRRVGRRLHQLVNRWGSGILAMLLSTTVTDDLIMTDTDTAFSDFIEVVERFEGARLRAVSRSVAVAVQLFMDDSAAPPQLPIELVDGDGLKLLPRLSKEMQALFTIGNGS